MQITAGQLHCLAIFLGNVDFDELADAGVLTRQEDGSPSVGGFRLVSVQQRLCDVCLQITR